MRNVIVKVGVVAHSEISALGRRRQKDQEFNTGLNLHKKFEVSLGPVSERRGLGEGGYTE